MATSTIKAQTRIPAWLTVSIVMVSFICFGLPTSMLGVAWPSIRDTFSQPLDALGALLFMGTIGNVAVSFVSGQLQVRWGLGVYLALGCAALAVGLTGYAIAPAWLVMLLTGLFYGAGFGAFNVGMNTFMATNYGTRLMNWIHASFGLGATIGPLVMTALITGERGWRVGYLIAAALLVIFALTFALTRAHWRIGQTQESGGNDGDAKAAHWRATLMLPLVWVGIGLFFVSTGMQSTAMQWNYTLFTESRGIDEATAGLWSGMFWGGITAGRVFFGLVGDRLKPVTILRGAIVASIIGAGLIMWIGPPWTSFIGIVILGLASAPMYPLLVMVVPKQVGTKHAPNAIGFQIGAASLAGALVPAFAGVLADQIDLEMIALLLFVNGSALLVLHEVSRRLVRA